MSTFPCMRPPIIRVSQPPLPLSMPMAPTEGFGLCALCIHRSAGCGATASKARVCSNCVTHSSDTDHGRSVRGYHISHSCIPIRHSLIPQGLYNLYAFSDCLVVARRFTGESQRHYLAVNSLSSPSTNSQAAHCGSHGMP